MKTLNKTMFKALLALICAMPFAVSCYDDSKIWDKLNELDARVDSLQNNLDVQIKTLSDMLSGKGALVITDCAVNSDGSSVVTLSNGQSFILLPKNADASALVSVVDVNGTMCWAMYGEDGELVPVTDGNDKPVPVTVAIDVEVKDGRYVLVVNGNEYETCYDTDDLVQVFNSCTLHKDASDQVYAMTFDFGDAGKVTVAVDGYKGVIFKISEFNTTVVSEYFVNYGETKSFLMETQGVVDYIMQIPDGWRVAEKVEEVSGNLYVYITAPTKEAVAMGAAVAAGDLKVMSYVEGGKAAVTKLALSTDPFKTYNVTALKAVVDVYFGVEKFVYGTMLSSDFDQAQVAANIAASVTSSTDLPEGYFLSEVAIDKTHKEIYPELEEGGDYVFWTMPVLYEEGDEKNPGGYLVKEEMMRTYYMVPMSLSMELGTVSLLDATLKLEARGVKNVYAGLTPKTENAIDEIVYQINNGVYDMIPAESLLPFNGPASQYPDQDAPAYMEPETSYLAWVVVAEEEKTAYLASDVTYKEFKTLSVKEGGALSVATGTAVVESSSISFPVTCADAAMIYYAYLDADTGSRYSGDKIANTTKWSKILESSTFQSVRGSSVAAEIDGLLPDTEMWLYVVPVGHDGLYGNVSCVSATTKGVTFNDLVVTVETVEVLAKDATFKVSTDVAAVDYIYWVGKVSDPFWVSQEFCGGDLAQASKYLAANPDADAVVSAMKKHGKIAEDGTLVLSDLEITKEYVLIVLAKDASGNYSQCSSQNGYKHFQTEAIDFGEDFTAAGTPKWIEVKKIIENGIEWHKNEFRNAQGLGFGAFSFSIKIPQGLTAYISCFSTVAEQNGGSLADIMVEIEESCSAKTSVGKYVIDPETGDTPRHPDWVDDKGKEIQGSQVNIYTMYPHGNPEDGQVTFFAADAHGELHCTAWNNGKCSNYEDQVNTVRQLTSYEYWREYIIDFGNYVYNNDPYHEYSRILKDEAKIDAIAKQYLEIYSYYYKNFEPMLYVNKGQALKITNREAMGLDDTGKVVDKVYVMLKDVNGNYFEPMTIEVPNYFK